MKILMLGDVVGKAGRLAVLAHIPSLMEEHTPDFVIVNGENAAHGYGVTRKICNEFFDIGVDVITTGNHVWKQKEIISWIDEEPRVLRPLNFPTGTPGKGHGLFESRDGHRVLVAHPMGRQYMDPSENPFLAMDNVLLNHRMGRGRGGSLDAIVVDLNYPLALFTKRVSHVS